MLHKCGLSHAFTRINTLESFEGKRIYFIWGLNNFKENNRNRYFLGHFVTVTEEDQDGSASWQANGDCFFKDALGIIHIDYLITAERLLDNIIRSWWTDLTQKWPYLVNKNSSSERPRIESILNPALSHISYTVHLHHCCKIKLHKIIIKNNLRKLLCLSVLKTVAVTTPIGSWRFSHGQEREKSNHQSLTLNIKQR